MKTMLLPETEIKQTFEFVDQNVVRNLTIGGTLSTSTLPRVAGIDDPQKSYFLSFLGNQKITNRDKPSKRVHYIDLFCGGGGLSLGVHHAIEAIGLNPKLVGAVDTDSTALELVKSVFRPIVSRNASVENLIKYSVDLSESINDFVTQPIIVDQQFAQFKGKVDLLVGGPPCQGHSTLNNKTRGNDPRNLLYFVMPAFAVALDIPCVIIENVQSIKRASERVVDISTAILQKHGYRVEEAITSASDFGVAQNRPRHFLVASKHFGPNLDEALKAFKVNKLTFDDISKCSFMQNDYSQFMLQNATLSEENQARVDYLHDNDLFDLPNHQRPECHRDGHTYPSVYGRIKGNQPLNTLTTGFGSPGRGRFIHPHERRVINMLEAARGQAFPDWYWKDAETLGLSRNSLYKIIGDAVPSLMVMPLIAALHKSFLSKELRAVG